MLVLVWQSARMWYFTPEVQTGELQSKDLPDDRPNAIEEKKTKVTIYYEALCPDSKHFVIKQMLPTYSRLEDSLSIEWIPYGNAEMKKTTDGYEFKCQHGPTECEANRMHACAIDIIKNPKTLLDVIACMIKNNMEPIEIMRSCTKMSSVNSAPILDCYNSEKGQELLANYGMLTDAVKSKITFIPTIALDKEIDVENQAALLKNLLKQVCLRLNPMPKGCY